MRTSRIYKCTRGVRVARLARPERARALRTGEITLRRVGRRVGHAVQFDEYML